MLTAYYSKDCDSETIFADLEIGKSPNLKKHLNRYDVIYLDVQWCMEPAGGPEYVLSYIVEKTISELRVYYSNILSDNIKSLPEALSCIHAVLGKKFVILLSGRCFDLFDSSWLFGL